MATKSGIDEWRDIAAFAEAIVPKLERAWGCLVEADFAILQEAAERAKLSIKGSDHTDPNSLKRAGHYAFWIRKLKPLRIVYLDVMADQVKELAKLGFIQGEITGV